MARNDHEPADTELFRKSVADARPLPRINRADIPRDPPPPVAVQRQIDDAETLRDSLSDHDPWNAEIETGEELVYARNGLGPNTLRKLRRGHWVIQAQLDLHGLRVPEAREQLVAFLNECRRTGWRCVRIVHGKGLGSRNREPVLKRKVGNWLMQREEVLAYCQARRTDGGSGAVIVLLKSTRASI